MRPCNLSEFHRCQRSFNLRREAAPHATVHFRHVYSVNVLFQSQTRSRSTCDTVVLRYEIVQRVFQSQTRSRSTCDTNNQTRQNNFCGVSISDEKPLHMRRFASLAWQSRRPCFNLRREAAPHATDEIEPLFRTMYEFQSQTRSRSTCDDA